MRLLKSTNEAAAVLSTETRSGPIDKEWQGKPGKEVSKPSSMPKTESSINNEEQDVVESSEFPLLSGSANKEEGEDLEK